MAVGNRRRSHVQLKNNDENTYQLVVKPPLMAVSQLHVICKACLALAGVTNIHRFSVVVALRAQLSRLLLADIALALATMCG